MSTYFYRDNSGKEIGPLDLDALVKLRAVGVLNDNTVARLESSTEWKPLRELLPPASVPQAATQIRQKSTGKPTNSTWMWLLGAVVIIMIVAHGSHSAKADKDKGDSVSRANTCINNLRQIDVAANQFALEKGKRTGDPINFPSDLTPYIKLAVNGKIPACPDGGIYTISRVGENPTCSLGNTVTPNHALQ